METGHVLVSSEPIGSLCGTSFAHAQHSRKFPGWHLFSQTLGRTLEGKVVSTASLLCKKNNKLYVPTEVARRCVHLFRMFVCTVVL